jgi:hypothetical protein
MDKDINNMFKDKNKEIFINSLTVGMERNLESLKNTTDNCVSLEINKLYLFFVNYFQEIDLEYSKEALLGLLFKEKKKLNDIVNNKIEEKKQNIKTNFLENIDEINDDFVEKYYEELKKETERIGEELDLLLKEEIRTQFSNNVTTKFKLDKEEQVERIHSRINVLFSDSVIAKIKEQTKFRDESLRNMAKESYEKYLDINKSTVK